MRVPVLVSWERPPDKDLAAFRILWGQANHEQKVMTLPSDLSRATLYPNLVPGKVYIFSVVAVDVAGNESMPTAVHVAYIPLIRKKRK